MPQVQDRSLKDNGYCVGSSTEMNDVLGHDAALRGYTGLGSTWANEMSFVMKHAPARPVDQ